MDSTHALGKRLQAIPSWRALTLLWLLFLPLGCSDQIAPEGTPSGATAFQGNYDPSTGEIVFRLESPGGAPVPNLHLIATGIELDTAGLLHAQVAIRNTGSTTVPGPAGVGVWGFLPGSVYPVTPNCPAPNDSTPRPLDSSLPAVPADAPPLLCAFDHRGTYGDDGVLAGGETSDPVEWLFGGTGGESFAFHAEIMLEPEPPQSGTIAGNVFEDRNLNGQREIDEPGIAGVGVGVLVGDHERIAVTDDFGNYSFVLEEAGLYEVTLSLPAGLLPTTPTELHVLIVRLPDGNLSQFLHADFGLFREAPPEGELFITGFVYMDLDRNGVRDSNEAGIPDVGISASGLLCLSPIAAFARTDAHGFYRIRGSDIHCLLPWVVRREPVLGLVGTTPEQVILETRPPDGSNTFPVDFGLAPEDSTQEARTSIEGFVFWDLNQNGIRDADERGAPGAEVQLQIPCRMLPPTVTTNAAGYYSFPPEMVGLCPVTGVRLSAPAFRVYTTPNPAPVEIPTVPGFHLLHVSFGVAPEPK